jgi:hypothetical protein
MRRRARVARTRYWTIAGVLAAGVLVMEAGPIVRAHSGPPFPIVSNRIAGPYKISLWTDPDATDDGSAAGKFWVVMDPVRGGAVPGLDTRVTVSIRPLDRQGPVRTGTAEPVGHEASRRFVALLMDHEGRYAVRTAIEGPLGPAGVDAEVDATYDVRPRPFMLALALMPFLLAGFLWLKLLLRRRHRN